MKKIYIQRWAVGIIFCLFFQLAQAQNAPQSLGTCSGLVGQFKQATSTATMRGTTPSVDLKVSLQKSFTGVINFSRAEEDGAYLVGPVDGVANSTFMIHVTSTSMYGHILFMDTKTAYQYSSDAQGNAFVTQVDINKVVCINNDIPAATKSSTAREEAVEVTNSPAIFTLESNPGAAGCLYLDFDGETVSGTAWKNGATIVAAPSGMSDDLIRETWELVSEDYRPFNVNVTTNVNVFNTYPKNKRMKHITTTSKDVTTTGVAYLGSFSWNDDTPSWGTYTDSGKIAGEVAAHELGHTFNLVHDGRWLNNNSSTPEEYFAGNSGALAAPIMGAGYYNPVTQFSKGDYYQYPKNNNYGDPMQDDLALISGVIGYNADKQGNATSSAAALIIGSDGTVSASQNYGIIEKTSDLDFFSFTTSGGTVTINANTASRHADLNIELKLYNQSGGVIGTYNPAGVVNHSNNSRTPNLSASFSTSLAAGTYYISVNGVGDGDPYGDGFSEYGSVGYYSISGTVPNTISYRTPENPANAIIGLDYKYYEGSWNALPNFSSLTAVKSGVTSVPDISQRNRDDQFGFSYTGYIFVPSDGSYTFYTSSDDGSQLYIGSTLVVDNDGLHGNQEKSGTIGLKAGRHAIKVVFFEQGGDQVLSVSYAGPSINKQVIPYSAYYRVPANPAIATIYQHCNYDMAGYAVGLGVGNYTTAQLVALGALNNDISSLKVTSGYEVVLYDGDNFTGNSITVTSNNSCVVANNFNDITSSLIVRKTSTTPTNVPPSVSLTSPSNNASYTAPASITVSANASDSDGSVSKVDFYYGSTLIASDASSPYSVTWSNVAVGTYTITAKATDNSGATTTSSSVSVTVKQATSNPCSGLPQYVENGGYVAGSKVQNSGSSYECKPWPYSGWCNGAAWAYAPGTGMYWTDAWTLSGSCSAAQVQSTSSVNELALTNSPNPFTGSTTVEVNVADEGNVSLKVYDKTGKEVAVLYEGYLSTGTHQFELSSGALTPDMYIVRYQNNNQMITRKIIKAQ